MDTVGFRSGGEIYGFEYLVFYGIAYGFILRAWVLQGLSMGLFGGLNV